MFYRGADDPVLGGYALFCGGDPRARACEGGGTVYELQLVVGRGTALRFAFKRGLSEEIHERSGETVAEGAVRLDADATVEASYDFGTARPVR